MTRDATHAWYSLILEAALRANFEWPPGFQPPSRMTEEEMGSTQLDFGLYKVPLLQCWQEMCDRGYPHRWFQVLRRWEEAHQSGAFPAYLAGFLPNFSQEKLVHRSRDLGACIRERATLYPDIHGKAVLVWVEQGGKNIRKLSPRVADMFFSYTHERQWRSVESDPLACDLYLVAIQPAGVSHFGWEVLWVEYTGILTGRRRNCCLGPELSRIEAVEA